MTLEECKILHQRMWDYIVESDLDWGDEFQDGRAERNKLKFDFLSKIKDSDLYCLNNCVLCEYARKQYILKEKPFPGRFDSDSICCYCPAVWGTENILKNGFCEGYLCFPIRDKVTGNVTRWKDKSMVDWGYSDPARIRDIPFKDELENLEVKGGE